MMWSWHGGSWGLGATGMAAMMFVFWLLVVAGGVALWRVLGRDPTGTTSPSDAAARLLDERFARGEIDAAEYTARRDLLRSGGAR